MQRLLLNIIVLFLTCFAGQSVVCEVSFDMARTLAMLHDKPDSREYAHLLDSCGKANFGRSAYSTAMDYYLKALDVAEKNSYHDIEASIYSNIGNIYASSQDYATAISFYKRSIDVADSDTDPYMLARSMFNIFAAFYFEQETDSAALYLEMYRRESPHNPRRDFDLALGNAMLLEKKGRADSAVAVYRSAARFSEASGLSSACTASAFNSAGRCFESMGRIDSALHYVRLTEKAAGRNYNYRQTLKLKWDKARLFKKMGDTDSALFYRAAYLSISDSLAFFDEMGKIKNLQMQYEQSRSADKIEGLSAQRRMQRQWIVSLTVAIIVFAALVVALFRRTKKLKKVRDDLYLRNSRHLDEEIAYKQRIKALEAEIDMLKQPAVDEPAESLHDESPARRLSLSPELCQKLKKQIAHVMDDEEVFCSPEFNIERLAAIIGSKSRYVSEVINDEFGKTFRDLLNESRVKTAMLRIKDTEHYGRLTIKAIGESVGYKSQATFITAFTRFTGLKPSLYQKLAQDNNEG